MTLCSDWTDEEQVELCHEIPEGTAQTVIDSAITASSEILYRLTGAQFPGECEETLRPCGNQADPFGWSPYSWSYPWIPLRYGGSWVNTGPCGCNMRSCGCDPYPSVNTGRQDVQSVTEVLVDGSTLDASAYRLDSHQWVTRIDGNNWPCCQDLSKPTTETGTWSISITYGYAVPTALQLAAATYASELILACVAPDDCSLPSQTAVVVRQDLTMELNPQQFVGEGKTGITTVDQAIAAYNPNNLQRRATVWSPELSGRALRG